jgi:hypothetical protein
MIGHLDTPDNAGSVIVQDDYAYIGDSSSLRIIDVSVPISPVEVGSYTPAELKVGAIALAGNNIYFSKSSAIEILDVSDPALPACLGEVNVINTIAMDVQGDYAYVLEHNDDPDLQQLHLIDVSDVSNPSIINSITIIDYVNDIDVVGNYAYVANFSRGLRIYDISNPYTMGEVGYYDSPYWSFGVTVVDNHAYLSEDQGLSIIDVTNPFAPTLISFYETPGASYAFNCVAFGGNAYVANQSNGIVMLELIDPSLPKLLSIYDTPDSVGYVVEANGLIFATDGTNGLIILKPSYYLTGVVSDNLGYPLPGVMVIATGGFSTVTDDLGVYIFEGLTQNTYTITPSKKGYTFMPTSREVVIPPNLSKINFTGEVTLFIPLVVK